MLVRRSGISGARGGMLSELEGLLEIVSLEVMRESVRASAHYTSRIERAPDCSLVGVQR